MAPPENLLAALALAAGIAVPTELPAQPGSSSCPGAIAADATFESVSESLYRCFGAAAGSLQFRGETLDRLTVLARLATTDNADDRRELFRALAPVWTAVNGNNQADSPWRKLNRLHVSSLAAGKPDFAVRAAEIGVAAKDVEPWLVAILQAWREHISGPEMLEPWDYYYLSGAMERALLKRTPLGQFRSINDRMYSDLGVDPAQLGIVYDIAPRAGKDPVAYTDFIARQEPLADGTWGGGRYLISAAYAAGGVGNLSELLHETGHAVHIAAIRSQSKPDWPDSDVFSEALADVPALDLFDPEWQRQYLGASVRAADARRARYAGIALDTAWALFEIHMQANPDADPNIVWTDITREYLRIRPHPEWSWWAIRGQLISDPGSMLNYALGAILAADLRHRIREQIGPWSRGNVNWYSFVSQHLYVFGRDQSSRSVIETFLGRPVTPAAILSDMAAQ